MAATCATPARTRINGSPSRIVHRRLLVPKVFPEARLPPRRNVRGRRGPAATAITPSFSAHTVQHFNFRLHCSAGTRILRVHRSTEDETGCSRSGGEKKNTTPEIVHLLRRGGGIWCMCRFSPWDEKQKFSG
ncbi:hypothetical protein ANTQUA_LOCUS9830 [Anthophora quadrimaculata]